MAGTPCLTAAAAARCCSRLRGLGVSGLRWQHAARPRTSLKPGETASLTRRITEADVRVFAALTGDANPVHSSGVPTGPADRDAGAPRRVLVHGALLNAIAAGVIGSHLPGPGSIVVGQNLRFPRPCLVGEVVTTVVEVKTVRKIVEVAFRCVVDAASEDPKVVLEGNAKLILAELSADAGEGEGLA